METILETSEHYLSALVVGPSDELFVLCAASGELLQVNTNDGSLTSLCATESTPTGFTVATCSHGRDEAPGASDLEVIFTNHAEQTLLRAIGTRGIPVPFLSHYKGKNFAGPTAVVISPVDGEVFFTDAGAEGDSTLTSPHGAVYRTIEGRSQLVALAPQGLAQPSALAIGRDGCVYVCEQAANRVLRYVPRGAYFIGTVFAQLQGGMGPSAVAISPVDGSVYVSCYEDTSVGAIYGDPSDQSKDGKVLVFSRDGTEQGTIVVPSSELRGVAVSVDGTRVYVLAASRQSGASAIYRVKL